MKHQDLRKPEKLSVTLHSDTLKTLDLLCECFGDGTQPAERDYIVAGALQDAALDRKFQDWLKAKTASPAETTASPAETVTSISTARKPKTKAKAKAKAEPEQSENDATSSKAVSA